MPNSPAVRMMVRADSAPCRWPSMRGRPRCFAQRPLPSMMMATCFGREALASTLRWGGALIGYRRLRGLRGFQNQKTINYWEGQRVAVPELRRRHGDPPYCLNKNRLLAGRTDGGDEQFGAAQFGNRFQISPRFGRQLLPRARLVSRRAPPFKLNID